MTGIGGRSLGGCIGYSLRFLMDDGVPLGAPPKDGVDPKNMATREIRATMEARRGT